MSKYLVALISLFCIPVCAEMEIESSKERLVIKRDGKTLLGYQILPMQSPVGGDKFKGSNFIHPLNTPAGFTLTDSQPKDHLHHFGLWWPWKYIKVDGRQIVCWELQKGEGIVQGRRIAEQDAGANFASFISESDYIDRSAPGGPVVVLHERTDVCVSDTPDSSLSGYFLDIKISHSCATEHPVEIVKYRYSGFGLRGAAQWNQETSSILTSEGKDRLGANYTRAKWVHAQGDATEGAAAGILMMAHPENRDYPEMLRTWDTQHNGAIFINFNPVQEKPWIFEPGNEYVRRYRMFVYDGKLNNEQIDLLCKEYK